MGRWVGTVPSYFELNARLGWHPTAKLELAVVGEETCCTRSTLNMGFRTPRESKFNAASSAASNGNSESPSRCVARVGRAGSGGGPDRVPGQGGLPVQLLPVRGVAAESLGSVAAPFSICILGEDRFGTDLDAAVRGENCRVIPSSSSGTLARMRSSLPAAYSSSTIRRLRSSTASRARWVAGPFSP